MPVELLDLVGRQQCLAGLRVEGARSQIAELGAGELVRALAAGLGVAASVLHAQQLVLALVELVIADRRDLEAHGGERLDGGLVVERRRQQRARADQVAGGNEHGVLLLGAQVPDERRHVLGTAGRDGDLLGLVGRIGNGDAAERGLEMPMKIVDRQDRDGDAGLRGRRDGRAIARARLTPVDADERHGDQRGCSKRSKPAPLQRRHDAPPTRARSLPIRYRIFAGAAATAAAADASNRPCYASRTVDWSARNLPRRAPCASPMSGRTCSRRS